MREKKNLNLQMYETISLRGSGEGKMLTSVTLEMCGLSETEGKGNDT